MKLILVGDGDKRTEYERLATDLDVEFKGRKTHLDVIEDVRVSKAVVCPSECWETFGLSVVESMAEGTPAVVSDLGALSDLVRDGRCGEVFRAGDAQALAVAIKRLLKRADYDEVCKNCREEAEMRHSEEPNFRQLMDLYRSLISVG